MLIPERNKADLDEVPAEIKNDLEFIAIAKMDQLLEAALEEKLQPKPEGRPSRRRTSELRPRESDAEAWLEGAIISAAVPSAVGGRGPGVVVPGEWKDEARNKLPPR